LHSLTSGYPPNQSPNNAGDPPAVQLTTQDRGLSSPEVLSLALRQAERLFGGQVIAALSVCTMTIISLFLVLSCKTLPLKTNI